MRPFVAHGPGAGGFIIPKKPRLEDIKARRTTLDDDKFSGHASSTSSRQHQRTVDDDNGHVVWTGSLHYGDQHVESIDLKSPHRNAVKPSGFSSSLEVHRLVHWKDCLRYGPISELVRTRSASYSLLQKQFILLSNTHQEGTQRQQPKFVHASYFYLINTFSPLFTRLCKEMKTDGRAAFGVFHNGTFVLLIPEGDLSVQLGFPAYDGPGSILHCLFIVPHRDLPHSKGQYYSFEMIPRSALLVDKLDGADPKLFSKIEQYQKGSKLPIVQKSVPKQLDSLFTPNQKPPGGKVPTPYIPTPGSATYCPSSSTAFKNYGHPTSQPYNQIAPPANHNNSLHSLLYGPPPPPPPESNPKTPLTLPKDNMDSIVERRKQNKKLMENAFAAIRNIGIGAKMPEKQIIVMNEIGRQDGEGSSQQPSTPQESEINEMKPSIVVDNAGNAKERVIAIPVDSSLASRDPRLVKDPRRLAQFIAVDPSQKLAPQTKGTSNGGANAALPPLPFVKNEKKVDIYEKKNLIEEKPMKSQYEVIHETAPMDIDMADDRPYSPSQARFSPSPEPMELDNVEENDDEKERGKIEKLSHEEGGEDISMDISHTNLAEVSEAAAKTSQVAKKTVSLSSSSGFAFNYLDSDNVWNAAPGSSKNNGSESSRNTKEKKPTLTEFPESRCNMSDNSTGLGQPDDMDFRQLWTAGNTNGDPQKMTLASKPATIVSRQNSTESPISPPAVLSPKQQKPPSLMELNVAPPSHKSPPPLFNVARNGPPLVNSCPVPRQVHPLFNAPNKQQVKQKGRPQYRVFPIEMSPHNFQEIPSNLVSGGEHSSIILTDPRLQKHIQPEQPVETSPTSLLIIDPYIDDQILTEHFRKLLETAKSKNIRIKWHTSLTRKLERSGERANEYLTLLMAFKKCGVVDSMEWHYCDDGMNDNKQLICTMNILREAELKPDWQTVRLLYMSDNVGLNTKFVQELKERIRIQNPLEFLGAESS